MRIECGLYLDSSTLKRNMYYINFLSLSPSSPSHPGTDRNNIVEIGGPNQNYPLPWSRANMFRDAQVMWKSWGGGSSNEDLAIAFASAGYYSCKESSVCGAESVQTKNPALNRLLNNAPASFRGALLRFPNSAGKTYHYICSRNNNFTNRSQKGQLSVK